MSRVQQVKLVWIQFIDHLRNFRFRIQSPDDSVESQAEILRIWMWVSAAALAVIVVSTVVTRASADSAEKVVAAEVPLADQLPNGFVLVPIEPTNLDSLDSIFGQHGFADLYQSGGSGQKGRRIARGVALVRSPRNPRRFAVLVPEGASAVESQKLAQLAEPVLVILRKGPAKQPEPPEGLKVATSRQPLRTFRKTDLIEEAQPDPIQLNPLGENL
ncbi:hypothetical protein BH10BDE1_BH10BDE1_25590 [soil metagenome]